MIARISPCYIGLYAHGPFGPIGPPLLARTFWYHVPNFIKRFVTY